MAKTTKGRNAALVVGGVVVVLLGVVFWQYWPHIQFYWKFAPLGFNEQGLPEYRHRKTGIVLVRVPGGTFWMGAQKDDPEGPNYDRDAIAEMEGPVHKVRLSPFLIGKCELTQEEWGAVMGYNPSVFKRRALGLRGGSEDSRDLELPVHNVSWLQCQEFCRRTGLNMPSEAQWEFTCASGMPCGRDCKGAEWSIEEYCWFSDNSRGQVQPVGQKLPNKYGVHDLLGNVCEWCKDTLQEGLFYSRPEASSLDPVCTNDGETRAIRGGAFNYLKPEVEWDCVGRGFSIPGDADTEFGFRAAYFPLPK